MDTRALERRHGRDLTRAGLLLLVGLFVTALFVYLIGQRQHLFARTVAFSASFENVEGLAVEAPVWLGGMEVGRVTRLSLRDRSDGKKVWVHFEVLGKYQSWVKEDSVASISGRGLLGDKAIDVSLGSPGALPLEPGTELLSAPSANVDTLMRQAGQVMKNAEAISASLKTMVEGYAQAEVQEDVHHTLRSLRNIMSEVERGDGVLHALVYDDRLGKNTQALLRHSAHSAQTLDEWLKTSRESPDGLLAVLGDKESGRWLKDLSSASQSIKEVMAKVREGEGSLGGLIQDPTVYEDLKQVLGNLRRNRLLRAMVRFLLVHQEDVEKPAAREAAASPAR